MRSNDLPLHSIPLSCQVIAFPATKRDGHARKVAEQLARARTEREADWFLHRAISTNHDQMIRAGLSVETADQQSWEFRKMIYRHCIKIGAKWVPALDHGNGGGAA